MLKNTIVRFSPRIFVFIFASTFFLLAQNPPERPATAVSRAAGVVRTASGVAIPGANLRLTETKSGRAWISWTDENGHFDLPGLPIGHYQIETNQLGFDGAVQEFDLSDTPATIDMTLKVASLEAIEATSKPEQNPNQAPASAESSSDANARKDGETQATHENAATDGALRRRQFPNGRAKGAATEGGENGTATEGNPRRGGIGRPVSAGQGSAGQSGGFQQVFLNNQRAAEGEGEAGQEAEGGGEQGAPAGPLGQAASSDAFLMNGTVGQGDQNAGFGGFPGGGFVLQGAGDAGQNGFGGTGGFRGGAPTANPGGAGAPGLPGGRQGGGPAIAFRPPGGGRPGPAGRGAPPARGVPALYGMQRVLRQRINRVRASLFNVYGNSVLNARPYSLTQPNAPKVRTWHEEIGGNLGGPLVIPHVYDGHDKTFFFINVDSGWARNAVDQFSTVPTLAERQQPGNLCDRGAQLYIPNPADLNGPRTAVGCQIPSSLLNPAALGLLQYIPEPNLPGFVQNYHLQTRVPTQQNRLNMRVLHSISPKLNARIFYSFSQDTNHAFQSFPDFESTLATRGQSLTLGLTQNLSRTWINDSQLIFSRNRVQTLNNFAFTTDVAGALGITGVSTAPIDWAVPQLTFNNLSKAAPAVPSLVRNQTYRFVDSVTHMLAKHTLTLGAEIRRIQNNTQSDPIPEGLFSFSGLLTTQIGPNGSPVAGTGLDFADFLLGYPASTNVRFGIPSNYFRSWGTAGYISDDWRVRSDFTLQVGLRYEFFTPPTELYGHLSNLDFNPNLAEVALVTPRQTAPLSGAVPESLVRPQYNHWSPRIGMAWRPPIRWLQGAHSTVVRAGYSVFYNESIYSQLLSELANQPPWSNSQLRISGPGDVLTLQNGFPATAASRNTIQNTYAVNPNYKVGYAQIWNLSVETTVASNTALVLTYTGTKGTNLDLLFAPNRTAPGSLVPTGPVSNAGNFIYDTAGANSIYNSLQVRLQKRLSHGIMINGTYTFAKSLDNASSIGGGTPIVVQDSTNLAAEYGLSSFDIRHQARINYLYELPFGDGHRLAQKGLTAALFANWRFSGNIGAQTGTPYTAQVMGTSAANVGSGGLFATRADQICDPNTGAAGAPLNFFNTSCFVVPPPGQLGNAGRNTITGPGMFTWNAQIAKTIPFGKDHEHRLDIRWEITNLTNTPNLTGLSTLVNSLTFGQVNGASAMRTMNVVTRFTF